MNCKHLPATVSELIPGAVDAVKRPPLCSPLQVSPTTDTVPLVQNLNYIAGFHGPGVFTLS